MKNHQDNYLRGERWYAAHRHHRAECNKCGKRGQKRDFFVLYYRAPSYSSHCIMARLCHDCLMELATDLNVEVHNE
jgi:hypothetical protein